MSAFPVLRDMSVQSGTSILSSAIRRLASVLRVQRDSIAEKSSFSSKSAKRGDTVALTIRRLVSLAPRAHTGRLLDSLMFRCVWIALPGEFVAVLGYNR